MLKKDVSVKRYILIAVILLAIVAIGVFVYYRLNVPVCSTTECFFKNVATCTPSKFFYAGNISFDYSINGKDDDHCNIDVTLVRSFWRGTSFDSLNGKSMVCDVPFGKITFPEEDLDKCHGPLKENLQELILQKLHGYIIDNLDGGQSNSTPVLH
ncbi:Uncharacterised protein [uncultured archaeon]|nr:Uncharacterised protein [uncultured archaeon]